MNSIKKYLTLRNVAIVIGLLFIVGIIYYILGGSGGVSIPLGGIVGTQTLANYMDKIEYDYDYQQVRYIAPQAIQENFPIEVLSRIQKTGDYSQRAYFEVRFPDITFNTTKYGVVVVKQPAVRVISVIKDQLPEATYFSLDIPNIDEVLTKLEVKRLLDMMATYPTYSRFINEAVNPILYEKAWLYISIEDVKKMQEQSGDDSTMEIKEISVKDIRKAAEYVSRGLVVLEAGTENGLTKLTVRPDINGLIVGLKKLRSDEKLIARLGIDQEYLTNVIMNLEDMEEKERKYLESIRVIMYLKKEAGKYRVSKVKMFMVLDEEQTKELIANINDEIKDLNDPELQDVFKGIKVDIEKNKRIDFGALEFSYEKIPVELPDEGKVVNFAEVMEILEALGAVK